MSDSVPPDLDFHLEGVGAGELVHEFASLLEEELETRPERRLGTPPPPAIMRTDLLTAATFILALPSAVLAAIQLAERLELKKKIDRILDWARRVRSSKGVRVRMVDRAGRRLPLDRASSDEVIEFAVRIHVEVTAQGTVRRPEA